MPTVEAMQRDRYWRQDERGVWRYHMPWVSTARLERVGFNREWIEGFVRTRKLRSMKVCGELRIRHDDYQVLRRAIHRGADRIIRGAGHMARCRQRHGRGR